MSDLSASNIQLILQNLCNRSENASGEELNEVFLAVSSMCRDSVAIQSELADGDICNLIISVLNHKMLICSESNMLNKIITILSYGIRAILALVSGNNSIVNQTVLAKCVESKICNVAIECLNLSIKQLARYDTLILPSIHATGVEAILPDRAVVHDLAEHSLMLTENLLLHPLMYCQLVKEDLGCGILLVDCLKRVSKVRSVLVERCLSALGNLVSHNSTSAYSTTTLDGAEVVGPQSIVHQCVDAGLCDGIIAALTLSGCEDVSTADCALFLVQSLAVISPEAVNIFQSIRSGHLESSSFPQQRLVLKPAPSPSDLAEDGAIALLVRVLGAHCPRSPTVVESALGAIGALVLQSSAMTLQLMGNRGVQAVTAALSAWGAESSGICSRALRILTAAVQMTRHCKKELHRVNSYFELATGSNSQGLHTSASTSRTEASLSIELNVFDEDEEDGAAGDGQGEGSMINIGVDGATAALVFRVLERMDLACLLMGAENGALEREIASHDSPAAQRRVAGMAAVGSLALAAIKVKSFKESISSSKKSTLSAEAAAEASGKHSKSTSALPRLVMASRALTAGTPINSSSISNLKAALDRAKLRSQSAPDSPAAAAAPLSPCTASALPLLVSEKEQEAVPDTPVYVLVLRLLECHGARQLEVLHPALQLLLELCGHYALPYQWIQVSNSSGCAVLVKALANNRSLSAEGAGGPNDIDSTYTYELGLQALQNLAQCNLETRDKLCQLSAHTVAVDALHYHGEKSVALCRLASEVFVQLYGSVSAREANEGNPRACAALLRLLQQHQAEQHMFFAETGMCMLKTLALFSPNRRILAEQGGCAVIAELIRSHTLAAAGPRHPRIAYFGLATLSHLAGLEDNQSRIAKCGGCRLVVQLLLDYGAQHESVAAEGLTALSALAMSNSGMLGEVGACEAVVSILRRYSILPETPHDLMLRVASVALFNLCFQYSGNKERFQQLDIVPELKKLLNYRGLTYATREAVKDAVNIVNF